MKLILTFICILFIVLIFIILYAGNYLYNLGINPSFSKDLVFKNNTNTEIKQKETSGSKNISSENWFLNFSNYVDLYITSNDGLKLHNFIIKNKIKSNKWVIAVHGYTSQGIYMSHYAKNFYDMGYNIIIPDLRGHGKSEGTYIGMGWHERFDILDLINYIINNYSNSQIVLFGVSMGAATVMSTSGEILPQNVKAVIEDCGYTSAWNQFSHQLKSLFKLPAFPLLHIASVFCKLRAGYFISEVSIINQIKKSITPTLFIHGDNDNFVPFFMLDKLYNASQTKKEKLIISNASHAKASTTNPNLYWTTVKKFLNKYVK